METPVIDTEKEIINHDLDLSSLAERYRLALLEIKKTVETAISEGHDLNKPTLDSVVGIVDGAL
jgi:hypothetical protein